MKYFDSFLEGNIPHNEFHEKLAADSDLSKAFAKYIDGLGILDTLAKSELKDKVKMALDEYKRNNSSSNFLDKNTN